MSLADPYLLLQLLRISLAHRYIRKHYRRTCPQALFLFPTRSRYHQPFTRGLVARFRAVSRKGGRRQDPEEGPAMEKSLGAALAKKC